jgi:hypothetical protein
MDRTYANEPVASSWTLASGSSSIDVAACMGEASLVSKSVDRVGNACVLCLHGRTQAFKEGEYVRQGTRRDILNSVRGLSFLKDERSCSSARQLWKIQPVRGLSEKTFENRSTAFA